MSCRRSCSLDVIIADHFSPRRVSAVVPVDTSSNDTLRRFAEVTEFHIKYDFLPEQLNSVSSECRTWHLLGRDRVYDTTNLQVLLGESMDKIKLIECEAAAVWKSKEAVPFEQDASNAKVSPFQPLLSRYQYANKHVANRFSDGRVPLEAGGVAAVNKAEDEKNYFARGLFLSMKDGNCKYITCDRSSVSGRTLLVEKILRCV